MSYELSKVLDHLSDEERHHFLMKAQGAEEGELFWYFEGRHSEAAQVSDWLRAQTSGLLILTGRAGCGKSALLGQLLIRSLADVREALIAAGLTPSFPADEIPPAGVFDEVIHLTGVTLGNLIRRISHAAELGDPPSKARPGTSYGTANDLDWLISGLRERRRSLTLLVDALDESTDPLTVARSLLRRLVALPGIRIVVGTRPSTQESPDYPVPDDQDLLDALGGGAESTETIWLSTDPEAVSRYVSRRLSVAVDRGVLTLPGSPVTKDVIHSTAAAIAMRGREFLFARLAAHEILADPSLLSPQRSRTFTRMLNGDHRQIFTTAIGRLSRQSDYFLPLLESLALARGRGVPILDGVWSLMANALLEDGHGENPITDADVSALLAAASPYIVVDSDAGQTVYRLAHRTFVEHFFTAWEG